MQFKALRCLSKSSTSGQLDPTAVRALQLPMPDDVLEQFVLDHGLDGEFQREYAELDLYGLSWKLVDLSCAEIVGSWSKFEDCVTETAANVKKQYTDKPRPPFFRPEDWDSWISAGTWLRAPIFLDSVIDGRPPLHLVEGHTRVGRLTGLQDTPIKVQEMHSCWVGKGATSHSMDWASVLEAHHISFGAWIFDAVNIEEASERRDVAERLGDAESALRYTRAFGRDFKSMVELASIEFERFNPRGGALRKNSGVQKAQLVELVALWRRELEATAGRPLKLTP